MSRPVEFRLGDLREKLAGYRLSAAARYAGLTVDRLTTLEADSTSLTVSEAASLAAIYGLHPDQLEDLPVTLPRGSGIGLLALQDEFHELSDEVRHRVVRAANAARQLNDLRRIDGQRSRAGELPRLAFERGGHLAPYRQGATHAQELRKKLGLGMGPVESMRDLVTSRFPSIAILYAHLSSEGPAGLAFAGNVHGPAIVLNLDGKNTNPGVRRFSLAHELYHLLADWNRREPLATLSGFLTESGLEREQRANGFAVRLLCPESRIRRITPASPPSEIREIAGEYGLHYAALRLYIAKVSDARLPPTPPRELVGVGTELKWQHAEEPEGLAGFPLEDVPTERRTDVARLASHMFVSGKLSRRGFAEALEVSPIADLEAVLSFFALDRPSLSVRRSSIAE